jgi:hypothetical protein
MPNHDPVRFAAHLPMVTGVSTSLIGITDKQKAEAVNFELFKSAYPNFAGREVASVQ